MHTQNAEACLTLCPVLNEVLSGQVYLFIHVLGYLPPQGSYLKRFWAFTLQKQIIEFATSLFLLGVCIYPPRGGCGVEVAVLPNWEYALLSRGELWRMAMNFWSSDLIQTAFSHWDFSKPFPFFKSPYLSSLRDASKTALKSVIKFKKKKKKKWDLACETQGTGVWHVVSAWQMCVVTIVAQLGQGQRSLPSEQGFSTSACWHWGLIPLACQMRSVCWRTFSSIPNSLLLNAVTITLPNSCPFSFITTKNASCQMLLTKELGGGKENKTHSQTPLDWKPLFCDE